MTPKYTSPEDMQTAIDSYFAKCAKGEEITRPNKRGDIVTYTREIPVTVLGLSLHLGFVSHQSLFDYANRLPAFSDIITRAKTRIAQDKLAHGLHGDYDARITQLDLAANHGMSIKHELEVVDNTTFSLEEREMLKGLAKQAALQTVDSPLLLDGPGDTQGVVDNE